MRGVVLYGPPASGKSTVASRLHQLDSRLVEYPTLKAGSGRHAGYRMTTASSLDRARRLGSLIWGHQRYGATYAIDRATLVDYLKDFIPVVQLGQVDAVRAVVNELPAAQWVLVYLWCPRDIAEQRILARGTGDTSQRLRAWDETAPLAGAHVRINTALTPAEEAAAITYRLLGLDHTEGQS